MLGILILLMAAVAIVLSAWAFVVLAPDTVVVVVGRIRLGWHLVVIKLSEAKPPWANRSLLNYVRDYAARYSPLRITQRLTEHVIERGYVSNRVKANVSESIVSDSWILATLTL